ncbi:glycosyltransferase family 4 protein [Pontibacter harenae]|uniref:glycosyltransferase family 4 protein n=1 Tax=Pontibacter harenae TaxID=2894083 RepID=UPI001E3A8599|nr:glycosyltransferase family 4 protein [Pontibacter harenae]MCC9168289.1 glycosyltransferase family 4 protein [Pontibacter harenae]
MQITILNQHHTNPDCPATSRHYSFLEQLTKRHKVTLVTTDGWRSARITNNYSWVPEGVELHESTVPYANKMGVVQRLKSFAGFAAFSFKKAMELPKPDIIWAVSTPLSTPWVAAQVAKLRGVPWVFEVQDLWPKFPIEMGAVKNKWLQQRLYVLEKSLYKSAAHIITLSPNMTDYVASLGISRDKITTNYNGTDLNMIAAVKPAAVELLRERYQLEGKRVVLYAGTYGRANDIPTLMKAIEVLASEPEIKFVFTGSGYYEPQLQELAARMPNLLLLPPQNRQDTFELFKLADLSLVTFSNLPVLAANSPAKFYDSLGCGTPVIVTNPGWTNSFVQKYNVGWYTPAEQHELLAQTIKSALADAAILQKKGANGAIIAKEIFDRQMLVTKVEQVLQRAQQQS